MDILYGKPIAEKILAGAKSQVRELGRKPTLCVFCDNVNPYYTGILNDAAYCGVAVQTRATAPDHWTYLDAGWDGMISLIPGFKPMDSWNVDGGFMTPCTAEAVMLMLEHYNIPVEGKNVCIIGRSERVGKPVAKLMLEANATITVCHSKTRDIAWHTTGADIIVSCAGNAGFDRRIIPSHAVVVDIGGDFLDPDQIRCAAMVPYIGGVGPVTRAVLMRHVCEKARGY